MEISILDPTGELAGYECDQCGACCKSLPVLVSLEDAAREPRIKAEAIRLDDALVTPMYAYQLFPLAFHESCCFLQADNKCNIYATRPDPCRDFLAGDWQCQDARKEKGIAPLLPKAQTAENAPQ